MVAIQDVVAVAELIEGDRRQRGARLHQVENPPEASVVLAPPRPAAEARVQFLGPPDAAHDAGHVHGPQAQIAGRDRSGPRGVLGETPHSGHLQGRVVGRPDQQDGAAGLGDDLFRHAAEPQPRQAMADGAAQDDQVDALGDDLAEDHLRGPAPAHEGAGTEALGMEAGGEGIEVGARLRLGLRDHGPRGTLRRTHV